MQKMRYRLALDLGSTSLGWAMLRLNAQNEPCAVIKAGVRIFSDGRNPKDGSSLAVSRREARAMRRHTHPSLVRQARSRVQFLNEHLFDGQLPPVPDHTAFGHGRLRLPPCWSLCVTTRSDRGRTGYAPGLFWFAACRGRDVHTGARDGSPLATTFWAAQPIEPAQPAMGRQDVGDRPAPITHRLARWQVDRSVQSDYILPNGAFIHACRDWVSQGFTLTWMDRKAATQPEKVLALQSALKETGFLLELSPPPVEALPATLNSILTI